MSSLSDVISSEALALSGASAEIVAALTGKTWEEAKALIEDTIDIYGFDMAMSRGDVVTYALNGRTLTSNLEQFYRVAEAIDKRLKRRARTGGISILPVEFSDA